LILDSRTALAGMRHGTEICMSTLIPSLFPFMVLSGIMTGNIDGKAGFITRKLGRFCKIPQGTESILLTGFLGGYPVGARNTVLLYEQGLITRKEARRMCVFCNNAGPSFLFGILMPLFADRNTIFLLWMIQILSAILLAHFLPDGSNRTIAIPTKDSSTVTESVTGCIHVMGKVCAWVVLFRMVLEFLNVWFLWRLPVPFQVLLTGILELSNGCLALAAVEAEPIRFLLASIMLSFGGICVCLQTASICPKEIRKGYYCGKMLHALLTAFLSLAALTMNQYLSIRFVLTVYLFAGFILILYPANLRNTKKEVAF